MKAVKLLVSYDPKLLSARGDFNDECPIHFAASLGHLEIVQWIISQDLSMIYKRSDNGNLPVHWAILGKSSTVFEWLSSQDPQTLLVRNNEGCLPIFFASRFIAQHEALLDYCDQEGNTLLHLSSTELSEWIFEKRPLLAYVKNSIGQLPIHSASMKGDIGLIQKLMAFDPKFIEEQDDYWCLPLHFPGQPNETAQAMIAPGCGGELPIHRTQDFKLLSWMVKKDSTLLKKKDDEGRIFLHSLANNTKCDPDTNDWIAREKPDLKKIVRWAIKKYPNTLKAKDKWGRLPIDYAEDYENFAFFKLLT